MKLFDFLYNTMLPRVNNPKDGRYWLPKVLEGIDGSNSQGKLLPLEVDGWNVGNVGGDAGVLVTTDFKEGWASFLEKHEKVDIDDQPPIVDPQTPFATLSFSKATINGLPNLNVLPDAPVQSDGQGYHTTITLQTNYYDGTGGRPTLAPLSFSGNYNLSQKFCTADSESATTCNGNYATDIDGQGLVSININKAFIEADVDITVDGTGAQRAPRTTIRQMRLRGATSGTQPELEITDLQIVANVSTWLVGSWVKLSKEALTSAEGQAGIFSQINIALNSSDNLKSLSDTVTAQLQVVLNDMIGAVPDNMLPSDAGQNISNAADMYLFDRMRFALNNASGQWYLPMLLCNFSDPSLEPLTVSKIDLPQQSIMGMNITTIQLLDLAVSGLSNMLAPSDTLIFNEDVGLQATIDLSALTNPPAKQYNGKTIPAPPLKGTGNFAMMFEDDDETYPGSFVLEVTSSQLHFTTKLDGSDLDTLQIIVLSASIGADPSNVRLNITIDSDFNDMINQVLNTPSVTSTIIGKINDALADNLGTISDQITASARAGIASRLDS